MSNNNEFTKLKSSVKHLEVESGIPVAVDDDDPTSRAAGKRRIAELEALAQKKIEAGFVKRMIPIKNGYKEVWVLP